MLDIQDTAQLIDVICMLYMYVSVATAEQEVVPAVHAAPAPGLALRPPLASLGPHAVRALPEGDRLVVR